MKKVVLIKPKSSFVSIMPRIPLALLYIGTVLKNNGVDVKIIDANVDRNIDWKIQVECKDASFVGISVLTSEVKEALIISQNIKAHYNVPIVWGGIHPTLFPELTCGDFFIDYVVVGEGEYTLLELVQGKNLADIKGLVFKRNGKIIVNEHRPYINLDQLPELDYSLVDMSKYFEGGIWRKAVDVQTSRGCPYKCKYCFESVLGQHKFRSLSAKNVVDNCEILIKNYGANFITFVDDNFFLNKKRAKQICEEIINRNLNFKWFAEVRADYFKDGFIDEDFLKLAEQSGLTNVTIGAESGVQSYLEMMDKGITTEQIEKSAVMLSRTNIVATYSFIIGLPDETKSDIMETVKFIKKLKAIYPNAVYNIGTLRAYPKCELTDVFVKRGIIKEPESLEDFADYKFSRVYIESPSRPIWHKNPDFAIAVVRYTSIAYGAFSGMVIHSKLKFSKVLLFPETIFKNMALWRLEHQFFILQIDRITNDWLHKIYQSKFVRKIAKWRK